MYWWFLILQVLYKPLFSKSKVRPKWLITVRLWYWSGCMTQPLEKQQRAGQSSERERTRSEGEFTNTADCSRPPELNNKSASQMACEIFPEKVGLQTFIEDGELERKKYIFLYYIYMSQKSCSVASQTLQQHQVHEEDASSRMRQHNTYCVCVCVCACVHSCACACAWNWIQLSPACARPMRHSSGTLAFVRLLAPWASERMLMMMMMKKRATKSLAVVALLLLSAADGILLPTHDDLTRKPLPPTYPDMQSSKMMICSPVRWWYIVQ